MSNSHESRSFLGKPKSHFLRPTKMFCERQLRSTSKSRLWLLTIVKHVEFTKWRFALRPFGKSFLLWDWVRERISSDIIGWRCRGRLRTWSRNWDRNSQMAERSSTRGDTISSRPDQHIEDSTWNQRRKDPTTLSLGLNTYISSDLFRSFFQLTSNNDSVSSWFHSSTWPTPKNSFPNLRLNISFLKFFLPSKWTIFVNC